jgi:hypothetical protein
MRQRRGYILLTVLLLLMLASVVMASFCRIAIARSLEASAANDELQRRWGTLSCRDALLPRAENLLEEQESTALPVEHLHTDFNLGREQFSVDICDEQAKVNVNALYALQGKDRAERSILNLVRASGGDLKPRLRLTADKDLKPKSAPPTDALNPDEAADTAPPPQISPIFGSWSEVFPDATTADLFPSQPGNVTTNLTCWGNGSLNLRRASIASITAMCSPTLSPQQIAQLLVLRGRLGDSASVDQLLAEAHIGTTESFAVSQKLTLASATQSLWIVSRDHSETQRRLFVRDASNSDDIRSFSAQW